MPNWSEGTLKVRGKYEDVVNFFKDNLQVVNILGEDIENGLTIEDYRNSVELILKNTGYIKGTRRNFTEADYFSIHKREDDTACAAIHVKGAWAIESEPYVKLSKDYEVDIKIEAFECGMEFNQYILIEKGNLIEDKEITYDDYIWECVNPDLGG